SACEAAAAEPGVVGVVVTHGTDTLEETAFFLDLTLDLAGCAVVVTGSQRAPHQAGSDAHRNLADAILVAGEPLAAQLGAVVVFHESIYAARHVRKVHSYQLDGFGPPASASPAMSAAGAGYTGRRPGAGPGRRSAPGLRGATIRPSTSERPAGRLARW